MKRFALLLAVVVAFLFTTPAAHAQIGIYGAGTGASYGNAPVDLGYGGMVGVYKTTGHFIGTGLDLRATFTGRDGFKYNTYAIGPRISFRPRILPLSPYVEGLVGLASYNSGRGTGTTNHFNYQALGGLDLTVIPRVDWRIAEIAYSGVAGQDVRAFTFSMGLVVRVW